MSSMKEHRSSALSSSAGSSCGVSGGELIGPKRAEETKRERDASARGSLQCRVWMKMQLNLSLLRQRYTCIVPLSTAKRAPKRRAMVPVQGRDKTCSECVACIYCN